MIDPFAVGLKFVFVVVLYMFVVWAIRSSLRELRTTQNSVAGRVDPLIYDSDVGDLPAPIDLQRDVHPRLVVVAALGTAPGYTYDLTGGATLGRAENCDVVVDDPFASSVHARIVSRGPFNYIEDVGSTNGTYLSGHRLERPEQLERGDRIKIGDTEFRYEE